MSGYVESRDLRRAALESWENENLRAGKYIGSDLRQLGFHYELGQYVPIDTRYSAMLAHRWAICARDMS